MKEIMISIQPQWVEKILNGEKTIEIRKTKPSCELPVKVYIYCSKGVRVIRRKVDKGWLKDKPEETTQILLDYNHTHPIHRYDYELNGKVVAEFTLNKIDEFQCGFIPYTRTNLLGYENFIDNGVYKIDSHIQGIVFEHNDKYIDTMIKNEHLSKMCLSPKELFDYVKTNKFYAWHINDLKIYNKPKSLSDFHKPLSDKDFEEGNYSLECAGEVACMDWPEGSEYCADCIYGGAKPLTKAPQNWCYVEELEDEKA